MDIERTGNVTRAWVDLEGFEERDIAEAVARAEDAVGDTSDDVIVHVEASRVEVQFIA